MPYWMARALAEDKRQCWGWWLTLSCVTDGVTIMRVAKRSAQEYQMARAHLHALVEAGYLVSEQTHEWGNPYRFSFARWSEWHPTGNAVAGMDH